MSNKTNKFVSDEDLAYINKTKQNFIESGAINRSVLDRLHHITFFFDQEAETKDLSLDESTDIFRQVDQAITVFKNSNEAVYAHFQIQLGKILCIIDAHIKNYTEDVDSAVDKKKKFTEIAEQLFDTEAKRSNRYKLMQLARIPKIESYSFLGISRLKDLIPIISTIDSDDPLGTILEESGYEFSLKSDDDIKSFKHNVAKAANKVQLADLPIPIEENDLEIITKNKGIISTVNAKKIIASVNRGNSVNDAINNIVQVKKKKGSSPDLSPSYNKFEETCLHFTDMIEDILNDEYVPDYDGRSTATMLKVLYDLQSELIATWSANGKMNWKSFAKEME